MENTEKSLSIDGISKVQNLESTRDSAEKMPEPISLTEDSDYLLIIEGLNKEWLEKNNQQNLSADHQDYIFGDPAKSGSPTLSQDAERIFREQYPEKAREYDAKEKIRIYEKMTDDPAYTKLKEEITRRTNTDSEVRSALGMNMHNTWDRINIREHMNGMNDFVSEYPQKAEAYANRWYDFVKEHPETKKMNNAQWEAWCMENPGSLTNMSDYRDTARAFEHIQKKQAIDAKKPLVQDAHDQILEIRKSIGIHETNTEMPEKNPLVEKKEELDSLQLEDVASEIRASIPAEIQSADEKTLSKMKAELADQPYFPGEEAKEILDYEGKNEGVISVNTDSIVGSISPAFKNWSDEYENRKGRIVDIARELIKGDEESVEDVFHIKNSEHAIKLKKISGPEGDIFFVVDGTHRVAGAKLTQLTEIPAKVENISNLSEVRTTDPDLKNEWETRIKNGLIKGEIEETKTNSGQKTFNLKIKNQILPWANLPQRKFIKMTKLYHKRYPNSLDNLKSLTTGNMIPKEALLDKIGLNYFLANRWDEYNPNKK